MVLPSVSLSDLMGEFVGTYQYRSAAPVVSAPMMRTGAPFEKADRTPMIPGATPMSTLPEITACCVSPPPCVQRISSSRPCFLKMPPRWPTSAMVVSQLPRCPAATLSLSCACALCSAMPIAAAASVHNQRLDLPIDASLSVRRCRRAARERLLFLGHGERGPVGGLGNDALERPELHMRHAVGRRSDGQPTVANAPRRIDHDAPELHDRDVARAEPLAGAIGDR